MSWKWRYRDHPFRSQNLPQNICNYYINELIFELSSWWQGVKQLGPDEADKDQAGTISLELCFALPTHISPVRRWDKLLLRRLELSSWWRRGEAVGGREAKQLVPDEVDKDQAGTNGLELCFALPTCILPVRSWDKLLLRKLNPHQTAALDHYKSHPQIFVAICNFEDYKTFLLLPTAEIGVVFFFLFYNIYPSDFSLQLPVHPLPFRQGHRPFF